MVEEFLNLVTLEEALRRLLDGVSSVEPCIEGIRAQESLGRVLAGDVTAPEDLPGFERSSMDGFAVRAADTFGAGEGQPAYLEVAGEVPMGKSSDLKITPGRAVRISTGGVLPEGADAVVMVEDTEVNGSTLEVNKGVAPGENIVERDEDIRGGTLLFEKGQALGPAQIGALVGLGITEVEVFRLPVVGIISTGDELVPADEVPAPGKVRDVNTAALCASVVEAGCRAKPYGIVEDDPDRLLKASLEAVSGCDALLISGGSSAGVWDVTVDVIARLGKPGVLAHGIHLKPGKPTLIAVCDGKPVVGLPGNPASALAVFREVVAPLLSRLRGESQGALAGRHRTIEAVLDRSVASTAGRLELVPVALREEEGRVVANPILGKSSLIGTLARAHGNIRVPEGSEGLSRGGRVVVELLE